MAITKRRPSSARKDTGLSGVVASKRVQPQALEEETQRFGRRLFAGVKKHQSPAWKPAGVENYVMQMMMQEEDLRYRLLRFVDVYPALKDARAVAHHLDEYLRSEALATGATPGKLSTVARSAGKERVSTHKFLKWASRLSIERMGSHFIAGHSPEEVAKVIRRLEREGFGFTLDLLGEFVASDAQADEFLRRYMEMLERCEKLIGPEPQQSKRLESGPRVNLSIKLSSLASKFDPMDPEGTSEAVRKRLRPLFRLAMKKNAFLNVDMEKYETRELTWKIVLDLLDEEEFRGYPHVGMVHQAYLLDAEEMLARYMNELHVREQPMTIRLVKGAYWDSEQIWARQRGWPCPVFLDKRQTDAMFERCTEMLLHQGQRIRTAVGSHNVRSLAYSLALKKLMRIPGPQMEIQMLYGMAGPIKDAVRELGVPVRIYTPSGELIPGMSYLVRRILENTSNESFLRQRFTEGVSERELLADPKVKRSDKWTAFEPPKNVNVE